MSNKVRKFKERVSILKLDALEIENVISFLEDNNFITFKSYILSG